MPYSHSTPYTTCTRETVQRFGRRNRNCALASLPDHVHQTKPSSFVGRRTPLHWHQHMPPSDSMALFGTAARQHGYIATSWPHAKCQIASLHPVSRRLATQDSLGLPFVPFQPARHQVPTHPTPPPHSGRNHGKVIWPASPSSSLQPAPFSSDLFTYYVVPSLTPSPPRRSNRVPTRPDRHHRTSEKQSIRARLSRDTN